MIGVYLNQTATWKRVVGRNGYGEPVFEESSIKVRWEGRRRLVRNKQGQEVISEARVFCTENVQPGDVLEYGGKEWPVITVSEMPGVNGKVQFREVAV